MRRAALVVAATLAVAAPATAELGVWIDHPTGLEHALGLVEVVAKVESSATAVTVQFFVDGELKGVLAKPPYRLVIDVGNDNVEHRWEVVAKSNEGETARDAVDTPKLKVDDAIDLKLQQLYVTVSDGGRRVTGLSRGDFRVIDDGEPQEIVTFERGDVPLTAVLLLDASLSMRGSRLAGALNGASVFLGDMKPLDEAMVVLFSDRLHRATGFSHDKEALRASLTDVEAAGGTSLNDHLFFGLSRLDVRQGRRVVVLFTDGADVHSALSMSQVLRKAQSSPALIYWIHLLADDEATAMPGYYTAWRDVDRNLAEYELLERAVIESGGRVQIVRESDSIERAFSGILAELREQYVLGYYPTRDRGDGAWHEVRVRVPRKPGLRLRTRDGYLDY